MNLLVILFFIFSSNHAQADDCDKLKAELPARLKILRQDASGKLYEPVNDVVYQIEKCHYSLKDSGTSMEEITKLRRHHFLAALDELFESDSASTDPNSARRYIDFLERAKKLGFVNNEVVRRMKRNIDQANQLRAESIKKRNEHIITSCSEKRDYSAELPPVRDQSINGWCYAYAASDLITQKLKKNISPIDLAFGANNERSQKDPSFKSKGILEQNGGEVEQALRSREKDGYCLSSEMDFGEVNRFAILYNLNRLKEETTQNENSLCESFESISQLYKKLQFEDFIKILETSEKDDYAENLRKANCRSRVKPEYALSVITKSYGSSSLDEIELRPKITENILSSLNEGRIVSIGLDITNLLVSGDSKNTSDHAMVVVGNEFNKQNGQCEFIVRNSWGKRCDNFIEGVKCQDGIIRVPQKFLENRPVVTTEIQ